MKKLFLITVISLTYAISNAQEIGLRFGDVSGGQVAIDGVFETSRYSRVHADVSFGNGGVGVDVLWDFLYRPLGDEAVYWYMGVGPYAQINDPFWLGVAGEIGLEYHFKDAPVAIGLDWRPAVSVVQETAVHAGGFGLNVRYVF